METKDLVKTNGPDGGPCILRADGAIPIENMPSMREYRVAKMGLWDMMADYAEMYLHASADEVTIEDTAEWHLLINLIPGDVSADWTAHAGASKTVTVWATNAGGTSTLCTCANHGMAEGDVVSISGTTNYDGVYAISAVTVSTFVIAHAFVNDDGAHDIHWGSHMRATNALTTGRYLLTLDLSVIPLNAADIIEVSAFQNATQLTKLECVATLGALTVWTVVAGQCLVNYVNGDVITVAVMNNTGGDNVIVRNANISIIRIG